MSGGEIAALAPMPGRFTGMSWGETAIILGGAVVLGVVVPSIVVAMMAPKLAESELAARTNYRGRRVFMGLGIAWLVWAVCATLFGFGVGMYVVEIYSPGPLLVAGPLALVAFVLGLVDDALGSPAERGFKGHFRALIRLQMTTGMLKLVGISLASVMCAWFVIEQAPWETELLMDSYSFRGAAILVAGAAIALTSNFVNLVDLRPGRALKTYIPLGVAGALLAGGLITDPFGSTPLIQEVAAENLVGLAALAIFALGPVIAVWRYDLGERGMLGDAGANPMGAVAGLLIVTGLPLWGLVAYFVVILGLNLLSERFSFSSVIEASPPLRWLDRLGRLSEDAPAEDSSAESNAGNTRVTGEG